jgi:hypothetical protein
VGLINGVPAHVLFVHAVVVLIPLSALALVICAVWPQAMRRFGVALPVLALVSLIAVPLTTNAGEWLKERVPETSLVERHAGLGDELLPWAVGLLVLAVAVWFVYRRVEASAAPVADGGRSSHAAVGIRLRAAAVVLSLVVAVGAVVQVYRIGDSGAKASWEGRVSSTSGG